VPNNSLSYPKVCKRKDGKYYVDFKLSNKRYRMFSGAKISSSLSPNSYPAKLKRPKTELLAREVYNYLVRNNYSFKKKLNSKELFDSLISSKLSEPLSATYYKTLKDLSEKLSCELISKGEISTRFLDGIVLRHKNNTSYNTTRRHLNILVNYLYDNGFPMHKSKLKTKSRSRYCISQ
jgi:hypothetical protein